MGIVSDRVRVISTCVIERLRHGLPTVEGPLDHEVLFILDGVGRFQFAPLIIRKVFRSLEAPMGTIVYDWQFGLTGEIWTDLMWLRRNRLMAARLARQIVRFRRDHPTTSIHVFGYSGGAGVAVMACEHLRGRRLIDTLLLAAPALSPTYNLAPALGAVERCYALISPKDRWLLGTGTTIFGTIDRCCAPAAGMMGFRIPRESSRRDRESYSRIQEVHWTPELKRDGPSGGHIGWMSERFMRKHLLPLLSGKPLVEARPVAAEPTAPISVEPASQG